MKYIYALIDPRTEQVRYVGATSRSRLGSRLSGHINDTQNHLKRKWIRELLQSGHYPKIEVLDEVPDEHWRRMEKFWICQFPNLFNKNLGGGDTQPWSEARRKKQSRLMKKRWKDFEYQKRHHLGMKKVSEEFFQLIQDRKRMAMVAKWQDPEYLAKMAKRETYVRTPKLKAKMSKKLTGFKHTEEFKEKCRERMVKESATPEWKKRRSESQKKLWADPEYRERMVKARKKKWEDPKYRKQMTEAQVRRRKNDRSTASK